MMEKVSLIIPVYNVEKTIFRCLNSIKKQTYHNFEALIINDGSKDNTAAICDYFAMNDKRFVVFHRENAGVSVSRNFGLENSTGSYLMFIDGDDEIRPDHIKKYVEAIETSNSDVVIGGLTKIDSKGNNNLQVPDLSGFIDRNDFWNDVCDNPEIYGYMVNKLFRLSIVKSYKCRFREDFYSQEDLDFCLSVYNYCESFFLFGSCDYIYYLSGDKRRPIVSHYIRNQCKLLSIAEKKADLTERSKNAVAERILVLIHTALYCSYPEGKMEELLAAFYDMPYLMNYLCRLKGSGEKYYIAKLVSKKKKRQIKIHYWIRCKLKKCSLNKLNVFSE